MQVHVSVIGGAPDGLEVEFQRLPVTLGREGDPRLPIADRWASRHHCELFEQTGQLFIRDLASKHGTYVNGACIDQCELEVGDRVMVGLTVFAVSEIRLEESAADFPLVDRGSSVSA